MREAFITPKRMNQAIHEQIRYTLLKYGDATKAEISLKTDISFPTVSKAIEQMELSGEVLLTGIDDSSGGRRPARYALNAGHQLGLAVYLERDETVYSIINYVGEAIERFKKPTVLKEGPEALTSQLQTVIDRNPSIRSIAIGVPGSVRDGKIFFIPLYDKFAQLDLKSFYEERFSIPVQLENDMNAAVLGYHGRSGRADHETLAYVYLGKNGPGAGIFLNGDIIRGSTFFSGEVSFIPQYDRYNFFEAVSHSAVEKTDKAVEHGPDMIDAMSRMVATFVAIINPHAIIFCSGDIQSSDAQQIKANSANYVPEVHIPELIISDWEQDYVYGLQRLALNRMMASS
ncbi:ROK family protein [Paenibacillus luteus]|uniref:ROK family protein n=1 Tax=Paenibacillus luteus TaxID=2545753 RepID=UPI0011416A05|nr:ROK family protein [Paenibacillus luteus]